MNLIARKLEQLLFIKSKITLNVKQAYMVVIFEGAMQKGLYLNNSGFVLGLVLQIFVSACV